jgi:TetR/AcrR family tetracycline transcriptional repressor
MTGKASGDGVMRRRLVDAARAVVESAGPDALSMRKVAADVGVAPTAIYWHVGSREELLAAVLDVLIADLPRPVVRGRTPGTRIASLARGMRAQALATTHTQLLARQLGRSAELFLPAQIVLARELSAAGLHGAAAADATRAVLFVVGGFVLLEDSYREGGPALARTPDLWRGVEEPGIDPELRAAMSRATTPDALFEYTIDHLLAAILGE